MRSRSEAFLVVRHGRIVVERYVGKRAWLVPVRLQRRSIASMSKALVGGSLFAVGLCDGWLDPDTSVGRFLAAWRDDPEKREVTFRDLATHTSGLASRPASAGRSNPGSLPYHWARIESRAELSLHQTPALAERGKEIRYSNPGYTVYSIALAKAAAAAGYDSDVEKLLESRVLRPLNISDHATVFSFGQALQAEGTAYREVGSGSRFTPRAVARLGEMVAHGGSWRGKRIIDERCIDEMLHSKLDLPLVGDIESDLPAPAPAAGWWTNANRGWPELPSDLMIAAGAEHRVLVVVPSLDLVVVRLGMRFGESNFSGDFWSRLRTELLQPLLKTIRPEADADLIARR